MTLLRRIFFLVSRYPKLLRCTVALISRLGLLGFARTLHERVTSHANISDSNLALPTEVAQLGPHARHIYAVLKTEVESRNKGGA